MHERLHQSERAGRISQMIGEKRKRELAWPVPFVGPLEAGPAEDPKIESRVERGAVDRHLGTV